VLSTSLLAAALLAALPQTPAAAADKPAPVKKTPGPVMSALQAAWLETQAAQDSNLPLNVQLDRMAAVRYTPDTAAKLSAVFGNDRLFTLEHQSARPGRLLYRARMQPLHYVGEAGSRVDWDEALLDFDMDQAGKAVDVKGSWDKLAAEEPTVRFSAQGMRLTGHAARSHDRLWFGNSEVRIDSMRFEGKPGEQVLAMNDTTVSWRTVERPKAVDMQLQYRIGSIEAAGEKVEDLHFDMRMVNLDRASMVALQAAGERQRKSMATMTPEQQAEAMKPVMLSFGKAAILRGAALEIDELSARYRGNKASLRGRVGFSGAVEADLNNMTSLMKKLVARFEIRVPVAIVRDIAGVVAERQAKQQGTAQNGMSIAQVGQTMTDVVIGKLVGGGFARIENDVLVSNLEFRNGKLTANGKEVALPKTVPSPAPPAPVQRSRSTLPPGALQARRIEDSCLMPDYPDEVLRQDRLLRATFAYRVDAQGNLRQPQVLTSSGYADWDMIAVEALGQCRYIPALKDGKPIEVQMRWELVREAGSVRPRGAP
jgi:TonB family protein